MEIHVVNWCTSHADSVENGSILCHTKEEAIVKMSELYEQSKAQIERIVCNEFHEDEGYYFVMGALAEDWERANISVVDF